MDWSQIEWGKIGLAFVALLAVFRAVAEFLKFLSEVLKSQSLFNVGEKILSVLNWLAEFIGKFGFGSVKVEK